MSLGTFVVVCLFVTILTIILMEPWSSWVHRVVWHGPLWSFHRSHHQSDGLVRVMGAEPPKFEKNDWLALAHAPVAMGMLVGWYLWHDAYTYTGTLAVGVGLGMTIYGFLYVLIHDGVMHGRLPVQFLRKYAYIDDICQKHALHHQKNQGPYGFFWHLEKH